MIHYDYVGNKNWPFNRVSPIFSKPIKRRLVLFNEKWLKTAINQIKKLL